MIKSDPLEWAIVLLSIGVAAASLAIGWILGKIL